MDPSRPGPANPLGNSHGQVQQGMHILNVFSSGQTQQQQQQQQQVFQSGQALQGFSNGQSVQHVFHAVHLPQQVFPPSPQGITGGQTTQQGYAKGTSQLAKFVGLTQKDKQQLAFLVITEQPAREYRFRYASEGPSHGGISGRNREFPSVKLCNYPTDGTAYIRACLYTSDARQRHVHKLVGPGCNVIGDFVMDLDHNNECVLRNLGIKRTKKKTVEDLISKSLKNFGAPNKAQLKKEIDKLRLNFARLCFQAFHKLTNQPIGNPQMSDEIYNTKSVLRIVHLSRTCSVWKGGDEVTLLCELIDKKDVHIRFYQIDESAQIVWQTFIDLQRTFVHHQTAIVFQTPPFSETKLETPVMVRVELYSRQGRDSSNVVDFCYTPQEKDAHLVDMKLNRTAHPEDFIQPVQTPREIYYPLQTANLPSKSGFENQFLGNPSVQQPSRHVQDVHQPMNTLSGDEPPAAGQSINNWIQQQHFFSATSKPQPQLYIPEDILAFVDDIISNSSSIDSPMQHHFCMDDFEQGIAMDAAILSKEKRENISKAHSTSFKDDTGFRIEMSEVKKGLISSKIAERVSNQESPKNTEEDLKENVRKPFRSKSSPEHQTESSISSPEHKTESSIHDDRPKTKEEESTDVTERMFRKRVEMFVEKEMSSKLSHFLRRFIRTGQIQPLLWALSPFFSVQNSEGDNALHLAVLHQFQNSDLFNQLEPALRSLRSENTINSTNNVYQTPLHLAVVLRAKEVVQVLLRNGADPGFQDQSGNTALHLAAVNNDSDCLNVLLTYFLSSEPHEDYIEPKMNLLNFNSLSALHLCVLNESPDCLSLLLEAGADPNVKSSNNGQTPLHLAVLEDSLLVETLLEQPNVEVDFQDYGGHSPLHLAVRNKLAHMVHLLMKAGADPLLPNFLSRDDTDKEKEGEDEDKGSDTDEGETPTDMAAGDPQLLSLLNGTASDEDVQSLETSWKINMEENQRRLSLKKEKDDSGSGSDQETDDSDSYQKENSDTRQEDGGSDSK